jgi:hypothetical protein
MSLVTFVGRIIQGNDHTPSLTEHDICRASQGVSTASRDLIKTIEANVLRSAAMLPVINGSSGEHKKSS